MDEDFEVPKDANLTVDLTEHSIPQVVHSALLSTSCNDLVHRRCRHRITIRDVGSFIVRCWIDRVRSKARGSRGCL